MSLRARTSLLAVLGAAACSDTGTAGAGGGGAGGSFTCEPPAPGSAIPFVDGTAAWGLDFSHHALTGFCDVTDTVGGPGVCAFDYDSDGDIDLYFTDRAPNPNRLYRNDGGSFTDVTDASGAGLLDDSHACLAFDFDGDQDLDLFVANSGPDRLLRNDGGVFVDATDQAGLAEVGFSSSATAGDLDGDGDLDLFVSHSVSPATCPAPICSPSPATCEAQRNALFINDGGVFTDETLARGLPEVEPTLSAVFFDFDADGDLDLFVGNDIGQSFPDRLYENDGAGQFHDAAPGVGLQLYSTDTMGVDVGDADGDGHDDLILSDFDQKPIRLVTCPDLPIPCDMVGIDQESTVGVKWGIGFVDFDQDGDLDVFHSTGAVQVPVGYAGDLHQLHLNDGTGIFQAYVPGPGEALAQRHVGRGVAFADLDGDLDLDVIVANADGPAQILINQAAGGRSLLVALDTLSAGARVTVDLLGADAPTPKRRTEHALVGGSYAGSSDPRVHFGLGGACAVDLTVTWPGGQTQKLEGVTAGQLLGVTR